MTDMSTAVDAVLELADLLPERGYEPCEGEWWEVEYLRAELRLPLGIVRVVVTLDQVITTAFRTGAGSWPAWTVTFSEAAPLAVIAAALDAAEAALRRRAEQ